MKRKSVIEKTVKALAHTPQYKMHKYFARRPYNVFRNLVKHYTNENDIVLDCFCGGGVTIFESLLLNRKVIGVDINPLSTFITEMQVKQIDLNRFKIEFLNFMTKLRKDYEKLYLFDIEGKTVKIIWTEWAYEVECPCCKSKVILSTENKISNGKYKCPNEECESNKAIKKGVLRVKCNPISKIPIKAKCEDELKNKFIHIFNQKEIGLILENIKNYPKYPILDEKIPGNWDRTIEDCLFQKGINKFSDLFTEKNYYLNCEILLRIIELKKELESDIVDAIYFTFSSSLRYTNNMSRVSENWENGNPTSMDKHAYWLPNQFVETNVLEVFEKRFDAILKGLEYTLKNLKSIKLKALNFDELAEEKDYLILNQSSSSLPIPDKSIDAVITDPPYGSNVQYAELSSFWNIWFKKYKNLDKFIYNDEEAVSNRKSNFQGSKSVTFYGEMLYKIFKEMNRVLKDEGYLVFTFNNKDINVWIELLKSLVKAGFYLPEKGVIYQDFISSYKNTSHLRFSGNIHGDFIYSFKKGYVERDKNFKIENYEKLLTEKIIEEIENLFKKNSEYSTTELYQNIISVLVQTLFQIISNYEETNEIEKVGNVSDDFIEKILNKYLENTEGMWKLKPMK
ncbi:MAG: DNA methyltransferase [Cetobacterium sp.]|uniref:DNA methyltransferase n=1 Tax=Cetobacterium sp. TaxID=2071632 RepID=UPI003EE4ABAF